MDQCLNESIGIVGRETDRDKNLSRNNGGIAGEGVSGEGEVQPTTIKPCELSREPSSYKTSELNFEVNQWLCMRSSATQTLQAKPG